MWNGEVCRSVASAPATSHVLIRKYRNANANSGTSRRCSVLLCTPPGAASASAKNTLDEHQIAIAGAATLNKTRDGDRADLFSQNEITSASSTTVKVPAAGPNRNVDVKTNVSETESRAGNEGILT